MRFNEIKFENNMRLKLPEWYKDDFLRVKKSGKGFIMLQRWYARQMKLDEKYELTFDELMSESWERIDN